MSGAIQSRDFRRLTAVALLLAGLKVACSSSDESAAGRNSADGGFQGGQTGSLVPTCGIATDPGSVPAGDGALIVHTAGCSTPLALDEIELLDAAGNPIAFDTVELEDGAVLLRTNQTLEPGSYRVSGGSATDVQLVVTEAEPLPMRLGELTYLGASDCTPQFELKLDESAAAYESLLKVMVSIDGGEPTTWVDYGQLEVDGDLTVLELTHCSVDSCLGSGTHTVEVTGLIAGEQDQPDPIFLDFDFECTPDAGGYACAFTRSGPRLAWFGWATMFALLATGWRRRSARKNRARTTGGDC